MRPDFFTDGHFLATRRVCLCGLDFGIGEFLTAALVSAGIGAETAGIAAPLIVGGLEGAGLGAASGAVTGGDPGQGALFGGLGGVATAGLGELAGGFGGGGGGIGADTGATFADSFIPATSGVVGGPIDAGLWDVAAGGFGGGAAGAGAGIGSDLGATFGDSFTPATGGTFGGPVDAGGFTAPPPGPTIAPGVESIGGPTANAQALGSAMPTPTPAPGPGGAAFTPPSQLSPGSFDLTSDLARSQGGSLFSGATEATGATVPEVSGGIDPAITRSLGGEVLADPGNLPVPPIPPAGGAPPQTFFSQVGEAISPVTQPIGDALDWAGKAINSPTGKLVQTGVSGLGLINSLSQAGKPNPIPGMADLQALATQLGQTGSKLSDTGSSLIAPNAAAASGVAGHATEQARTLQNYLTTGTLPPAVQSALDRATESAITNIKGQYAARGMPPGSSSEVQDINSVKQNAVIQGGTLAASLYSQGVQQDQLAASIYQNLIGAGTSATGAGVGATSAAANATSGLVQTNNSLNTGLNNAIAGLATSLGGGGKTIVNGVTVATA